MNILAPVCLAAGLLLAATSQSNAQGPGGGAGGFLTQDQRAKMRETMQSLQGEMAPLAEKLAAAQKEVLKAALAKDVDEKVVRAKIEAVAKIQTDLAMLRLKAVKEIGPTLTDEQKSQLNERPAIAYGSLFGAGTGGMGAGRRGGAGGGNQ